MVGWKFADHSSAAGHTDLVFEGFTTSQHDDRQNYSRTSFIRQTESE